MKKIFLIVAFVLCSFVLLASCTDEGSGVEGTVDLTESVEDKDAEETPGTSEHVHSFKENIVREATCSATGIKAKSCSCGEVEEGSEVIIPFMPHKANEATCTEDSVCSECGKLLNEKYDHVMIETVISEATCTVDGLKRLSCYRCDKTEDIVLRATHELDVSRLFASDGKIGSKCLKCGEVSGYSEQEPLLFLQFEDPGEIAKYSAFTFSYPTVINGAANPGGAVWMGYDVSKIKSLSKYVVSFDFCLTTDGLADKGESIFSFIGGVTHKVEKPGTKQDWVWAVKYFESKGVISTVMSGFNESNSYKVDKNTWYNFIGIVDNASREISVYINGTYIGKRTLSDYNDPAYGGAFSMRIYDAVPVNGTSAPLFDNLKIAEIK